MFKIRFNAPRQKYTVLTYNDGKSKFTIKTNRYSTFLALELFNLEEGD